MSEQFLVVLFIRQSERKIGRQGPGRGRPGRQADRDRQAGGRAGGQTDGLRHRLLLLLPQQVPNPYEYNILLQISFHFVFTESLEYPSKCLYLMLYLIFDK